VNARTESATPTRQRPRWSTDPYIRLGLGILAVFVVLVMLHPLLLGWVWPSGIYNPITGFDHDLLHPAPPSTAHLLGTDPLGRDVASMIMEGTKPGLAVSLAAAAASFLMSILVAGLATLGRAGRWTGWVVSNAALLLPAPIVMAILGVSVLGHFFTAPVFGAFFGLLAGASTAGLVLRSRALDINASGFIDAAVVAGSRPIRRFRRDIVPHLLPLATVYAFLAASAAIITDGFLAYLGLVETRFNWGTIVSFALTFRTIDGRIPWNVLISTAMALSFLTLAMFLIATGLRRWETAKYREEGSHRIPQ
jgi:peptide/nickel transport system permease protein